MERYPPASPEQSHTLIERFRAVFRSRIKALQKGQLRVRVPQPHRLFERSPDKAYHFKPELFLQTGGSTRFRLPEQEFSLDAPDLCIMPKGLPHAEETENFGSTFENVVVCFYSKTVTIHLAREDGAGRPVATDIFFFQTPHFGELVSMLNLAVELSQSSLPDSRAGIDGLLVAVLSLLLNLLANEETSHNPESRRVYQCQWLIRNHLNDSALSVQWLADKLDCSANYLSKLFHEEMDEKITSYIARIRLDNALFALRDTSLSVKEISNACGFRDPNYFSRIFKARFRQTPKQYRRSLVALERQAEDAPKLVRGDYEERHYGYDSRRRRIRPQPPRPPSEGRA